VMRYIFKKCRFHLRACPRLLKQLALRVALAHYALGSRCAHIAREKTQSDGFRVGRWLSLEGLASYYTLAHLRAWEVIALKSTNFGKCIISYAPARGMSNTPRPTSLG
jgi:hypothetical protein